jgi:microcystin-dependent protein
MGTPYVGEIRMFGGNFAPAGWAFCNGQTLPISENEVLFNLIGTTYGGDGQQTFNLPDLQGRAPIHMGQGPGLSNRIIGESAGVEQVTITAQQLPQHTHTANGGTAGNLDSPAGNFWSADAGANVAAYNTAATGGASMAPAAIGPAGGSQPHDNMQGFQAISFIISLFGIFPTQS